jgi:hypothetical protein
VRAAIYDAILMQGAMPSVAGIAGALACAPEEVAAAFRRLAQGHVIVPQPESAAIVMANPFSGVPTAFQVEAGDRVYWGNCVRDALGVLAMLGRDGRVRARCGDCGAAMTLTVRDGAVVDSPAVAHFAVPARRWWDDIVYT